MDIQNTNILEVQGVTIYCREGKWYWTVKSCAFDKPEEAFKDAVIFCQGNRDENLPYNEDIREEI